METILSFFSDLILFTFGLVVVLFWIAIVLVVADEIIDGVLSFVNKKEEDEDE